MVNTIPTTVMISRSRSKRRRYAFPPRRRMGPARARRLRSSSRRRKRRASVPRWPLPEVRVPSAVRTKARTTNISSNSIRSEAKVLCRVVKSTSSTTLQRRKPVVWWEQGKARKCRPVGKMLLDRSTQRRRRRATWWTTRMMTM